MRAPTPLLVLLGLLAACSRPPRTLAQEPSFQGEVRATVRTAAGTQALVECELAFHRAERHLQAVWRGAPTVATSRLPDGRVVHFVDGSPAEPGAADRERFARVVELVDAPPAPGARVVAIPDGYRVEEADRVLEVRLRPLGDAHGR